LAAAHCAYFLAIAAAHNPERATAVVIERPRALDLEHDNLRAALRWACAHNPQTALRLSAELWRFWFVRGHAIEGARWLERALALAPEPSRPRAAALVGLTGLDARQGRSNRHRSLGAQASEVMAQIGTPDEVVMARIMEATLAWSTFDLDDAEQLATDVRSRAAASGRTEFAAAASWVLGQSALFREDPALAVGHFDTCMRELAEANPATRPFLPVVTTCMVFVPVGDRMVPTLEETMLLGRRVGVEQATGYVLSALGYAHRAAGDLAAAASDVDEAIQTFAGLGDDLARAQALNQLGCTCRDRGEFEAADAALSLARELRAGLGDRRGQLLTEINVAVLQAMSGDVDRGLSSARHSLSGFESNGDQVGMGAALLALAAVELYSGEARAAREMYARAAQRLGPWRRMVGWLRLMVAELSHELGDTRRAAREVDGAESAFRLVSCAMAAQRSAALRRALGSR
jgi:tetratricopeptide (TPR) repeat protein